MLSHVTSSMVWLLHWILKNLIVLHLVTRLFWSNILIGCSGYVKSASSGATSGNTTFTGAFKHFFSCDMWKMSWTPANDYGNSSLYATVPHLWRMGNGLMYRGDSFPFNQTSSHPSLAKPLGTHDLQHQTIRVDASSLHSSPGVTSRLLGCLEYVVPLLWPHWWCSGPNMTFPPGSI
jgi:hypothetical protein